MVDLVLLDRLAGRQQGLLTTPQLHEAGFTDRQIDYAVSVGRLIPVRPGVYRVAGAPTSWPQANLAAVLGARHPAWVSHHSAAAMWGFPGFDRPELIHLLTVTPHQVRAVGVHGHRTTQLPTTHTRLVEGVPVTSIARTLIDVSGDLRGRAFAVAADELQRRKLLSLSELACTFAEVPVSGRRPSQPVHRYLHSPAQLPGGSDRELDVLRAIRAAGLPLPEQQWRVRLPGRKRAFLDFAYPEIKEALEFMGFDPHGRFVSRFHADAARMRLLQQQGWTIWPITAWTTKAELIEVVTAIADRLARHRLAPTA